MATQEDLASLFARNLTLQNTPLYIPPTEEPTKVEGTPFTYSISQHYHHSSHVVAQQPSRPASEPPQTDQLTTEIILSRHGVDSSSLYPSQIDLFKTADASQQMRLIELWRICPPEYVSHNIAQDLGPWPATSLQQEEAMAKLRYERQMLEERMARVGGEQLDNSEDAMSDRSTNAPMTPIQGRDSRWSGVQTQVAEPYMASGYESLAAREYEESARQSKDIYSHFGTAVGGPTYNHATDPVYNSVEGIHRFPNVEGDWEELMKQQKQAQIENQYGYHHGGFMAEDEEML
ncbi:hypothetical protein B7494_g2921 [Chlorociboria aeruginascens]|nr:hypothetical protein B7494_g2921 [Chlorociboria aeruginascens]